MKSLSIEEKEYWKNIKVQMESTDKLLGKAIIGKWCPTGPIRDPDTADDPKLAKKLIKILNKTK
jgi:hypothetical protein